MNYNHKQHKHDAHPHLQIEMLIFEHTKFAQLEVEKVTSQMEVQYLEQ